MVITNPFINTDTLDEFLLDVAVLIELSPRDRRVAENRYRRLKTHLERPESPLAKYLVDGASRIYAQGSIAISTTIVSGTDDDRFDVDAVVEIDVPNDWNNRHALDLLQEALQGFPGAQKIERCTRCVQLQFPFMHMDVTILDRRERISIERAGEIFHSPDSGLDARVPSNPWGFTNWFRGKIGIGSGKTTFSEHLHRHRNTLSKNRLMLLNEDEKHVLAKAEQHDLPPAIPSALDAQEAVSLKLLKRFLNLRYQDSSLPRPPSIYLTKRTGDVGYHQQGLSAQLYVIANSTAGIMRQHLKVGTCPQEVNPSYPLDCINDRWPRTDTLGLKDMEVLAENLEHLSKQLEYMTTATVDEIVKTIEELFGEKISKELRNAISKRYDRRNNSDVVLIAPQTGGIVAPAIVTKSTHLREVPRHNFHPLILGGGNDEK